MGQRFVYGLSCPDSRLLGTVFFNETGNSLLGKLLLYQVLAITGNWATNRHSAVFMYDSRLLNQGPLIRDGASVASFISYFHLSFYLVKHTNFQVYLYNRQFLTVFENG